MKKSPPDPLLGKLRSPIHINFIAKYILKKNLSETREILKDYMDRGLIRESNLAKDYFQTTGGRTSN